MDINASFQASVDFYLEPVLSLGSGSTMLPYLTLPSGWVLNKRHKFSTLGEAGGNRQSGYCPETDVILSNTMPVLVGNAFEAINLGGNLPALMDAIEKYDGSNGFTFKDW